MLHSLNQNIPADSRHRSRISSFLFVLLVVLGITAFVGALSYLYSKNTEEKESAQLLQNLNDKADVLVWALEGSARTMMSSRHNTGPLFISGDLLKEIANQPGIVSLCLVDAKGKILVHSDPRNTSGHGLIGENKHLPDAEKLSTLAQDASIGRFVTETSGRVYEVIKRFTPNDSHHMRQYRGNMMRRGHMMQEPRNTMETLGPLYIIVAFDAMPYDTHLLEVRQKNTILSFLVTSVASCLVVLSLVLYNFFRSHRLLKDARALASQIVTNLPIGLITTDKNGHITLFNSQSLLLLSLDEKSVPTSITQLPHLNWREIMGRLDVAGSTLFEEEIEIPLGETGSRAISLTAAKVHDSDGSESGYLCILRDLQTVKSLQKQIRLNERLSSLGSMAAGVAHEIRNPLSTLKGYATYLSEKLKNDPKAYATGHLMIEEVDRLNRVVTDLLYLAKPEQLSLAEVNLTEIAQKALQLVSFDASAKNIQLELSTGDTPLIGKGDADKLIQAFLNILLNSVQAITSDNGLITISVQQETPPTMSTKRTSSSSSQKSFASSLGKTLSSPFGSHGKSSGETIGLHQIGQSDQSGQSEENSVPELSGRSVSGAWDALSIESSDTPSARPSTSPSAKLPARPSVKPSDESLVQYNPSHTAGASELVGADGLIEAHEQYALIRIRDNGTGMNEETLANLFTPYFSTKASGSGLGMTITHQIINLHNGSISVSSVLGEGTVFSIRLPLASHGRVLGGHPPHGHAVAREAFGRRTESSSSSLQAMSDSLETPLPPVTDGSSSAGKKKPPKGKTTSKA